MPSALDVFAKDTRPSASSACFTTSATCTVSGNPTSGDGSRSKSTKSSRSGLSTREYHTFMSMQPMFTIHSKASRPFTSGASIHFRRQGDSRVETWTRYVVSPLGEADLADELRLDPRHVALAHLRHLRDHLERRRLADERPQHAQQLVDRPLVESGTAVADPAQLVALVGREHERAEGVGT